NYIHQRIVENLSDEEKQLMTQFFEEPVDFPKEWGEIVPYSEEFESERARMKEEILKWKGREDALKIPVREWTPDQTKENPNPYRVQRSYLDLLQGGVELTEDELQVAEDYLRSTSEYVRAWRRFVNQPEYEMMATPILQEVTQPGYIIPNFLFPQLAAKVMALDLEMNANEMDEEDRFALCMDIVKIGKNRPPPVSIGYLLELATKLIGFIAIQTETPSFQDPILLKKVLTELSEATMSVHVSSMRDFQTMDILGTMRFAKRGGDFNFDFTPGAPLVDYSHQLLQPGAPYYEGLRDPDVRFYLYPYHDLPFDVDLNWIIDSPFRSSVLRLEEFFCVENFTYWWDVVLRSVYFETALNLTRLQIANRIHELETGEKAKDMSHLVPKLLPLAPVDPFTDQPFLWDASRETFYSVGPDDMDDGNSIRYSPTNGSKSVGDVSVWIKE
ncbi:MAG: hypothetical protein KC978_15930, partial [Candidatus Omnitrophica bacterium]|nr:hypothetical protein [Candidatus Omnitrophota bacterium]